MSQKSPHYTNRREGVHYKILHALPHPIRHSRLGYWYWERVIQGEYSHFHCDPQNPCTYCRDYSTLSRLDRLRYRVEDLLGVTLGK